jgi:cell division protein FtsL
VSSARGQRSRGRSSSPRRSRRPGWLGTAGCLLLVLGSLFVVTWRQTRGVAREDALRATEGERAVAEAQRVELVRRIEELRSRARVVRVARERLDMHLPEGEEIIFLPAPQGTEALHVGEGER